MLSRIRKICRFTIGLAALQMSVCGAYGQVLYGTIVGNVTDVSNQTVANATVVVTNKQTGASATVTSNGA